MWFPSVIIKTAWQKKSFLKGLSALEREKEPTLVVSPECILLPEADCFEVQQTMVKHCSEPGLHRFAILDVHSGFKDDQHHIDRFRTNAQQIDNRKYAAAYYPWLKTNITTTKELSFTNLDEWSIAQLQRELKTELRPITKDKERINFGFE